jgi:phage/plasmid-associated DNA primase
VPAKKTVTANRFPKIKDSTTAFRERRLFIAFPNEFTGEKQIQNLEQVWLNNPEEKSGILNWMLEGLQRLLSQGYFTESKSQEETEIAFERASDTISAFLKEMAVFGSSREGLRRINISTGFSLASLDNVRALAFTPAPGKSTPIQSNLFGAFT